MKGRAGEALNAAQLRLGWWHSCVRRSIRRPPLGAATASVRESTAGWRSGQRPQETFGPDDAVTVICVTARPHLLGNLAENVARQVGPPIQMVLVTNADGFEGAQLERLAARFPGCRILEEPPDTTLGSCLNRGVAEANTRLVAKFDDDDFYGSNYLAEAVLAQRHSLAAIVGKHTYLAHLAQTDELVLRFPHHEYCYTRRVAGGTLLLDRSRVPVDPFPDVSLGEDKAVVQRVLLRGSSVFSTDRFNFVQHRGTHNTWQVDREAFLRDAVVLGRGVDHDAITR